MKSKFYKCTKIAIMFDYLKIPLNVDVFNRNSVCVCSLTFNPIWIRHGPWLMAYLFALFLICLHQSCINSMSAKGQKTNYNENLFAHLKKHVNDKLSSIMIVYRLHFATKVWWPNMSRIIFWKAMLLLLPISSLIFQIHRHSHDNMVCLCNCFKQNWPKWIYV